MPLGGKLDTHVVHLMREGRPEDAFLPNYRVRHPRGVFYVRRSSIKEGRLQDSFELINLSIQVVLCMKEGRQGDFFRVYQN